MTEIGLAQQRLLDDGGSSAGQRLPSTATPYSSEISQPGAFPAAPMYQYQQTEENVINGFAYARARQDIACEATQLVPPVQAHVFDYSTPGTSNHNDSPMTAPENMAANSTPVREHRSQKAIHRSKSLQSTPYSPHDTEPLSSVVSPHLSRAKSDNVKCGPMSPRSPAETHDELSLPAVTVEISAVKKKRGRPKKSSLPEDDEDDELAAPQEPELEQLKPEKKRPGRPKKAAANDPTDANDATIQGDSNAKDALELSSARKVKKAKMKRSKTADAILQKSHASASDDDVIWVESKPIQADNPKDRIENTSTLLETKPSEPNQHDARTSDEANLKNGEAPTTKERSRKRKKTNEQPAPESDETTKENQPPESAFNAATQKETLLKTTTTTPDVEADPNTTAQEAAPQTPERTVQTKSDPNANTNPRSNKGSGQHSPISSTSKVPYRVGLSKRARIAPLLKVVRK